MKHTPGPWQIQGSIGHYGSAIYEIENNGGAERGDEMQANVALIAAAPGLLEAAYQALSDFKWIEANVPKSNFQASIKLLEYSIAKAEGRSNE